MRRRVSSKIGTCLKIGASVPIARYIAALVFIAASTAAGAIEVVHVIEGRTATVEISATQPTLLRVEQGRLRAVRAEAQQLRVDPDRARGEAILTVQPGAPASITVFVTTERIAFPLVLVPADRPARTIVLREDVAQPTTPATAAPTVPGASQHVREVKRLVLAAAAERPGTDVQIRHVNQPVRLWAEVRVLHRRTLLAGGYQVEHWILTNVSAGAVQLDEQELYGRGIAAVAIERHHLAPGESTAAYRVRGPEHTP